MSQTGNDEGSMETMMQWMQGRTPLMTPLWYAPPLSLDDSDFPQLEIGSPVLRPEHHSISKHTSNHQHYSIEQQQQAHQYRMQNMMRIDMSPAMTPLIQPTQRMTPMSLLLPDVNTQLEIISQQQIDILSQQSQPQIQQAQNQMNVNAGFSVPGSGEYPNNRAYQGRKSSHKFAEQKRRDGLKDLIDELRKEVGGTSRMEVLTKAVEFVRISKEKTRSVE